MDEETKEKLVSHLLGTYASARESGERAARLGIDYRATNKCFGIDYEGQSYSLPANYVADHPDGGDDLADQIKRWAQGGRA